MEPGAGQSDPLEFDVPHEAQSSKEMGPAVAEVMELAEKLDPAERTQLMIWLWAILPKESRTAIMAFGLENLRERSHDGFAYRYAARAPRPSPLWQMLFDPKRTSGLYSAPRRFDLATIFVVTAAYSILFGAMSALDFAPLAKVFVGILVTTVAVSQAFYQNVANPRGISVITGAITLTVLLLLLAILGPVWRGMPFLLIVFFGVIGGALGGYLCGVLVGGVFLVADALRKRFERPAEEEIPGEESTEVAE